MGRKIKHMSMNIQGCLNNNKGKKINFLETDEGRQLSDAEARKHLADLQKLGHKLMCCSSKCEGFDPFGGGCPGHPVSEEEEQLLEHIGTPLMD